MTKFLGIQLSPTIVQREGLQAVMDRIQEVGADGDVALGQPGRIMGWATMWLTDQG